jgi:hypothetical protein
MQIFLLRQVNLRTFKKESYCSNCTVYMYRTQKPHGVALGNHTSRIYQIASTPYHENERCHTDAATYRCCARRKRQFTCNDYHVST